MKPAVWQKPYFIFRLDQDSTFGKVSVILRDEQWAGMSGDDMQENAHVMRNFEEMHIACVWDALHERLAFL